MVKKLSDVVYCIRRSSRHKNKIVHLNRLASFVERSRSGSIRDPEFYLFFYLRKRFLRRKEVIRKGNLIKIKMTASLPVFFIRDFSGTLGKCRGRDLRSPEGRRVHGN